MNLGLGDYYLKSFILWDESTGEFRMSVFRVSLASFFFSQYTPTGCYLEIQYFHYLLPGMRLDGAIS